MFIRKVRCHKGLWESPFCGAAIEAPTILPGWGQPRAAIPRTFGLTICGELRPLGLKPALISLLYAALKGPLFHGFACGVTSSFEVLARRLLVLHAVSQARSRWLPGGYRSLLTPHFGFGSISEPTDRSVFSRREEHDGGNHILRTRCEARSAERQDHCHYRIRQSGTCAGTESPRQRAQSDRGAGPEPSERTTGSRRRHGHCGAR